MLLNQMATRLGLPGQVIRAIARKANHSYKTYKIPKRTGGAREIHHPSKPLKALQRWLLDNVIMQWPVHDAAIAYRRKLGIAQNAERHVGSRYLLRMDFAKFFPSITAEDVMKYLENEHAELEWDATDLEVFISVLCRQGRLTIGAPTSPALSNAICFELDRQLEAIARAHGVTYTRYADDLFFSTVGKDILKNIPTQVQAVVEGLSWPRQLVIQQEKTRHSSKRGRRQVTGLVLKSDGAVGIGRHRKRFIRSLVHRAESLSGAERRKLAGLLAFARSVEPDFINALILKFGPERVADVQQMRDSE
jgi:RNA-directed DNA polymerase